MKQLSIFILFFGLSIMTSQNAQEAPFVTTAMQEGKNQLEIIKALEKGDKNRIAELLPTSADVNKPFGLFGFRGYTPLTLMAVGQFTPWADTLPKSQREEIARFLIAKGARVADLNEYLLPAVKRRDIEQVKLLLDLGAQDGDGSALKYAIEEQAELQSDDRTYYEPEIDRLNTIIGMLQNTKRGPLVLRPTAKPAPVQAKEVNMPPAPTATQPVRLVPKTKPASAATK